MAKRVSVDRWLFTVTMLLVFVGLVMVFSASAVMARERFGSPYAFLLKQLVWAAAGLLAASVVGTVVATALAVWALGERERADQEERGHSWPDYGRLPLGVRMPLCM